MKATPYYKTKAGVLVYFSTMTDGDLTNTRNNLLVALDKARKAVLEIEEQMSGLHDEKMTRLNAQFEKRRAEREMKRKPAKFGAIFSGERKFKS